MINNAHDINDATLQALYWVMFSDLPFDVHGSRMFGDAHDGSDFDFVIQSDKIDTNVLAEQGFVSYSAGFRTTYWDENTEDVWHKGNVQIILAKDIALRWKAQAWITERGIDRSEHESWDLAYKHVRTPGTTGDLTYP